MRSLALKKLAGMRKRVAGVDEAGRGPLAGPVVAAAVILDPKRPIRGLADSKQLTYEERAILAPKIRERALAYAVAWADREEIDALNILQATFLAMRRALMRLPVCPTHVEVDGNQLPRIADLDLGCTVKAIVGGDATRSAISAASILAKVTRDTLMERLDAHYPGFNFASHKGYSTPEHFAALDLHRPCVLHRRSFAPIANRLSAAELIGVSEVIEVDAVSQQLMPARAPTPSRKLRQPRQATPSREARSANGRPRRKTRAA
ncbi:MAG TPA: ribonuclease HII [Steroidobacteraceae bacterium]|jgi:ribonuclease HII|nr:ribonuclease HII [Steroidobacteraceae bacterium]